MSERLAVNSNISHYRILEKIGAGGMGEVFLALDTKLERKVALKILPADVASNQERMQRFVREAKAASSQNHPSIAHIYEIGESDGINFIAMEFVEGVTLREKIYAEKVDLRTLLKYLAQVADGLAKAHAAGIVHRDLKPDNIMISRDGFAKILDFGLAKLVEQQNLQEDANADEINETATAMMPRQPLSTPGMIMGTIGYMSPEQARGRKEIDQRSDIFSFGCVLFEAATGRTPFNGDSVIDTLHKITHAPAPSIRDLNPHAPSELQRIVRQCLQKDVDERYQTIKDVAIELRELRREMHTEAEIDYSISPQKRAATSNENENETKFLPANKDQTAEADALTAAPQSTSSAEYITGEIKRHKGPFAIVLTIVFLAAISFGYWFYFHRSAPTGTNQINSIAVLPFENASGNAELDYLSDGVSESVIDRLSQLPQLKVIARNSSFKYRGRNLDLKQIAEALGVDAIVTGSVVQRGDGYLMRVDVTDVRQNKQIWGKNFNRKISDVQILQSDISGEIAENLRLRLSGAQSQQLAQEGTTSPQAYEAMEKGRFFLNRVGRDNTNKAVEQFEQAIAFDPNYALAYSYLAEAYGFGGGSNLDREQRKAKRLGAALKAIELAPNLAEAHFALARIKFSGWEWAEAEREFKKAIELNPNFYRAHTGYASYLTVMGRHDEAIAEAKRSIELNPLNFLAAMTVSNAFRNARRNDEAIEAAKKALELEPNFYFTHAVLADAYEAKGMYPEALAAYHEALKRREAGGGLRIEALIGVIYAKMGERAKAVEILENLKANGDTSNEIVLLYDSLDKRDEAFAVLEQAFAERRGDLGFMRVNPKFDNLRPDPRFADLLQRMGLPQ